MLPNNLIIIKREGGSGSVVGTVQFATVRYYVIQFLAEKYREYRKLQLLGFAELVRHAQ